MVARTFEQVVAATDPEELARLNRSEKYDDPAVADSGLCKVTVHEDRHDTGDWHVSYFDNDGGCYVAVFAGRTLCAIVPAQAPMALAPLIIRWGPDTSSDKLRQCARCTACGHKGATLQHPGWIENGVGWQPFPVEDNEAVTRGGWADDY